MKPYLRIAAAYEERTREVATRRLKVTRDIDRIPVAVSLSGMLRVLAVELL